MSWLAFAGCWLALLAFAGGIWAAAWWVYRGSKQKPSQQALSRVDQLHADLHAREPAKVLTGPWMLPARCPDCGLEWQRPRILTDERCEPCKAKAWHAQEEADREQWEKSPGRIKMPDGTQILMSDALIIRKDWGSK